MNSNNFLVNKILSASLDGIEAKVIEVEASITKGLPNLTIVGLASSDIQEAKERAKSALATSNFSLPPYKITINLSPSDIKKSGTHFDLAIATLIALNKEEIKHKNIFMFGELGLDGKVKSSSLLFPIILSLKEQNLISKAIVPKDSLEALSYISEVEFYGVDTLKEAIEILKLPTLPPSFKNKMTPNAKKIKIKDKEYFYTSKYPFDFKDILGQELALRAALISAAGGHNILLNGSPGSGKSMIAKRLPYILPPLSKKEILSIAKHQFLDKKEASFEAIRPFRSPHHSATLAAIFGGGSYSSRIGEVALANNGVLFFDELPHFSSKVLEALREPMQDRVINIARVNSKITYKADFIFIGAMNPCPCGNLLSKTKNCRCSDVEIKRYQNRLSDPFLDRIELYVTMQDVDFNQKSSTTSKQMHSEVIKAFKFQKNRGQDSLNGKMDEKEIERFCILEDSAKDILQKAISRFGLSYRSINNVKKVARTIADLEEKELINKSHILEALNFRRRAH